MADLVKVDEYSGYGYSSTLGLVPLANVCDKPKLGV